MRKPEIAKKNPKLMFLSAQDNGFFEKIFNDELTAEHFISAQQLSWQVNEFVKRFMTKKRRRDRVADWKADYEILLGKSLITKYSSVVDQVIPQSVIFLCSIIFEIEVIDRKTSIDEVIKDLENEDYSKLLEYLGLIIDFANLGTGPIASWPTLLKSQSFYDNFSSYLKGRLSK